MLDQGVGAGVLDFERAAVGRHRPATVEHRPHAAGGIGARVRALDVLALLRQAGVGGVLGAERRDRLARRAEQLLDRELGVDVRALAVVVLEQAALPVPEVSGGPSEVVVQAPDLVLDVDDDRIRDAEALDRRSDRVGIF